MKIQTSRRAYVRFAALIGLVSNSGLALASTASQGATAPVAAAPASTATQQAAAAATAVGAPATTHKVDEKTIQAITETIQRGYFNGAFNALDTKAMAQTFHPGFAILGSEGEKLDSYSLKDWIAAIEARKLEPKFDPKASIRDCRLIAIDATDNVANVKAEIYQEGKLIFVDYLLLIKFGTQWKIVSKVYADKRG
jgi:hypothetical protein